MKDHRALDNVRRWAHQLGHNYYGFAFYDVGGRLWRVKRAWLNESKAFRARQHRKNRRTRCP